MTISCVTTCHSAGWEQYGKQMFDGWNRHVPHSLIWYTEGYSLPTCVNEQDKRITEKDNGTLQDLQDFKKRWAFYQPPYYLYDVVRFSHKVFAVVDAGMTEWVRPSRYGAYHHIVPVVQRPGPITTLDSSWARSAKPGTSWRSSGPCRRSSPVTFWPCWGVGRTAS